MGARRRVYIHSSGKSRRARNVVPLYIRKSFAFLLYIHEVIEDEGHALRGGKQTTLPSLKYLTLERARPTRRENSANDRKSPTPDACSWRLEKSAEIYSAIFASAATVAPPHIPIQLASSISILSFLFPSYTSAVPSKIFPILERRKKKKHNLVFRFEFFFSI